MAQKTHPCAADVAFCVMRTMVPVRLDRCYSVVASSNPLLARSKPALVYTVTAGVGLVNDDIDTIATWFEAN